MSGRRARSLGSGTRDSEILGSATEKLLLRLIISREFR